MEIFFLVLLGGGFMAWAVGANDVANAMGTSVGSKAISFRQAVLIAAVFEVMGALFAGQEVTSTIQKGLLDMNFYRADPSALMLGMMAALYASALWLIVASSFGWPVSTTHSIVGSIIGFGLVTQGAYNIPWVEVSKIAIGWVFTPIISAMVSWLVFRFIQYHVFSQDDPLRFVVSAAPVCVMFLFVVFARILVGGGMHAAVVHGWLLNAIPDMSLNLFVVALAPLAYYFARVWLSHRLNLQYDSQASMLECVEKVFAMLVVITAAVMAFSHGANDVANAIGPMVAAISILEFGEVLTNTPTPAWVMLWGASGVALGVGMYGYRVMERVGTRITLLSPSRSFAAQFSTGLVVLVASFLGFPVSTTQILVGGVLGVGFARGLAAVDMGVVRGIFLSWLVTIPSGAGLSVIFYNLFEVLL